MAKLIVNRKGSFIGATRKFEIYLNDELAGEVRNGQTTEINIATGEHTIRSGIGGFNGMSPTIKIITSDEKDSIVETGSNISAFIAFLVIVSFGFSLMFYFLHLIAGLLITIGACVFYFKMCTFIRQIQ